LLEPCFSIDRSPDDTVPCSSTRPLDPTSPPVPSPLSPSPTTTSQPHAQQPDHEPGRIAASVVPRAVSTHTHPSTQPTLHSDTSTTPLPQPSTPPPHPLPPSVSTVAIDGNSTGVGLVHPLRWLVVPPLFPFRSPCSPSPTLPMPPSSPSSHPPAGPVAGERSVVD
jgi:hypothetical protein